MLVEISIADLALIESQLLQLGPGLNVVSGETGTGKSTVLHAIELVLGGKPKPHMVREGAQQLEVQALFCLQNLPDHIRSELPDIAQAAELAITRTVASNVKGAASGRGRIYINGKVATQAILEQVGARLVTLCGQSSHIRLLQPLAHLEFIDQFGGHGALLTEYRLRYEAWRRLRQELQGRERAEAQRERLHEELEFRCSELESAGVRVGLRAELEEKIHRLSNAEKLIASGGRIQGVLEGEPGLTALLRAVEIELGHLLRLDGVGSERGSVAELSETFAEIESALGRFEGALAGYLASFDVNEEELEELRSKLAEVARLERKYKTNDAGLEQLLNTTRRELAELAGGVSVRVLRDNERVAHDQALASAQMLSKARSEAASRFAQMVAVELAELNMRGGTVEPQFTQEPSLGPNGSERCEFFFIAHSGETPKPLRQIASGGELSRLTLILKKLLRDDAGINVLVFDEVDSGISGSVARAVGLKLKELAQHSQVLCITHLPQVASLADEHFLVEKVLGDRATTVVRHLSFAERVDEVARMLSGFTITPASRESARELLGER